MCFFQPKEDKACEKEANGTSRRAKGHGRGLPQSSMDWAGHWKQFLR